MPFTPCHKLSHLLGPPPPLSVTYFMDGPSSIASFKPGSIFISSLSLFVDPSSSHVVDLRCIAGFPALFVGLRRIAGIPPLSGFPALSVDLRRVGVSHNFPRVRRSSGYLSFPRFRRSSRSLDLSIPRSLAPSISRVFHAGAALLSSSSATLD